MEEAIKKIIDHMTLEEKASLCSGKNFWKLKGIGRLGIPSIMVTDGPHGLRKQAGDADHLGLNVSVPATCFPTAVTSASSWDVGILYEMGEAIGEECVQEQVAVVLGPGVNMKRSPLCGRNFEYFSEDPFQAGEMAAAWVSGVQSKGIGTSLKHFAANNQEKARLVSNSIIDERALREIYLTAFEKTVKQAKPWTLMCSYNRINGEYSCENQWLLNTVLRKEWGFEGIVMTDWGAMNDRVKALKAGLELEMPGPSQYNDKQIVKAVRNKRLSVKVLDSAADRLITMALNAHKVQAKSYDAEAHHQIARKIASDSSVLLKNQGALPLSKGQSYGIIGAFAKTPRYQGAGSSKINPYRVDNILDALKEQKISYEYAPGYSLENDSIDPDLIQQAVDLAQSKERVVIFAGLPDSYESEGYDRNHLNMPESHNALIEAVAEVNENVTVVLFCGSPVLMPWRNRVKGILLSYLGGEAVGSGCVEVLFGDVNPSGHLAETFPLSLEDTPCYDNFGTDSLDVEYRESIFIGYRHYDRAGIEVAYPFGHGLSYTNFEYSDMKILWDQERKEGAVRLSVKNTGLIKGKEVVQLYIGKKDSAIVRAPKELRAFQKVSLNPGETKEVELKLDARSFSFYDVSIHDWAIEDGEYEIYAAASSRDIRLEGKLQVKGIVIRKVKEASEIDFETLFKGKLPFIAKDKTITVNTRVGDVLKSEKGKEFFGPLIDGYKSHFSSDDDAGRMMLSMLYDMPLRGLCMSGIISRGELERMVKMCTV